MLSATWVLSLITRNNGCLQLQPALFCVTIIWLLISNSFTRMQSQKTSFENALNFYCELEHRFKITDLLELIQLNFIDFLGMIHPRLVTSSSLFRQLYLNLSETFVNWVQNLILSVDTKYMKNVPANTNRKKPYNHINPCTVGYSQVLQRATGCHNSEL